MKALALALLLLAGPLSAQTGSVAGVVKTNDGAAAAGMDVAISLVPIADADDVAGMTMSDKAGRFHFNGIRPGKYNVTAVSAGLTGGGTIVEVKAYATQSTEIVVGGVARNLSGAVRGPGKNAHVLIGRWYDGGADLFSVPVRDGKYSVAVPASGRYALQAMAAGAESPPATPAEKEATRDLTLERRFDASPDAARSWIRRNAIALKTPIAGNGFDDMLPLRRLIGDARIVALGEATHGTREFFQFKHRMLEFLASEMNFDVFAIEASFPDALAVNDYVLEGKGDPAKALAGLQFWTWNTEEVLDMIKWMRAWNEDPKHARKLRFYGFDMQHPSASEHLLRDFLQQPLDEKISSIAKHNPQKPFTPEEQKELSAALDELAGRLDASRRDDRAWLLARQQVELLRQSLLLASGGRTADTRDHAMADNIRWLLDHEPPGTKMVVWAHNGHVSTESYPFAPAGRMGVHLRKMFGKDLVVIGLVFNRGSFQAIGSGDRKGLVEHTAEPLTPDSFDRTLADTGPAMFVLDLRRATGAAAEWLDSPLNNRSIGALYNDDKPKSAVMRIHPVRSFDAVFFINETTSAKPVGGRQTAAQSVPPAPAARNLDFAQGIDGWFLGGTSKKAGYDVAATSDGCVTAPCAVLTRDKDNTAEGFGVFMQRIDATPYRGKKIRFRAKMRSQLANDESSARIWLRVDRSNGMGFFDNMPDRAPKSLPDWTGMEITGDVALDAQAIAFGVLFVGGGTAWIDEATLEVVP